MKGFESNKSRDSNRRSNQQFSQGGSGFTFVFLNRCLHAAEVGYSDNHGMEDVA